MHHDVPDATYGGLSVTVGHTCTFGSTLPALHSMLNCSSDFALFAGPKGCSCCFCCSYPCQAVVVAAVMAIISLPYRDFLTVEADWRCDLIQTFTWVIFVFLELVAAAMGAGLHVTIASCGDDQQLFEVN